MQPPSGSAGGPLKYANPRDLPSYPSLGLTKSDSAATVAASLGWASQKQQPPPPPPLPPPSRSPRLDKPATSPSASASAAALLAHDNRMSSLGVSSEPSNNTSLRAATLAAGGQPPRRNGPPQPLALSSNAANAAYRTDQSSPRSPLINSQASGVNRRGSILAASGAMSSSTRPRAQSSPLTRGSYPDQKNAAANALSAATLAHRPSVKIPDESGAVPYTTMSRSMFTATPPVKPETDEQKKNDKLHSDAVAMARKIYSQQQAMFDAAKKAHGDDGRSPPSPGVTSLQDAAYKLAQQRMSKLEGENQRSQDYQSYYGAMSPTSRRFGGRRVLRRRASSDSDVVMMQDRQNSEQIRRQMSIFNNKVTEVDEKKRAEDRQALLALAQRNVQAQLAGMDNKITEETGWVNPSAKNEWELKAQAAARQRKNDREGGKHRGQIDIGGGKYMDMKAVEEIASKRMKPVLEEINEKVEKDRERVEKLRAEEEARKKETEEKKAKERQAKENHKKQRDQEKQEERERRQKEKQQEHQRKEKEKQEERVRREYRKEEERHKKEEERAKREKEKAVKLEQKKKAKEERRRIRELAAAAKALKKQQEAQNIDSNDGASDTDGSSIMSSRPSTPMSLHSQQVVGSPRSSPQQGALKTWLKTRLARPRRRSNVSAAERDEGSFATGSRPSTRGSGSGGFIGGAALTRSMQSLSGRNDSMRDIALAGRGDHDFLREGESEIPMMVDRPVSPPSSIGDSDDSDEEFPSRSRIASNAGGLTAPPAPRNLVGGGKVVGSGSLPRDSRFQELID